MPVLGRIHLTLMMGKTIPVPVKLPLSDALLSAQVPLVRRNATHWKHPGHGGSYKHF